jgi:hypothetical protein
VTKKQIVEELEKSFAAAVKITEQLEAAQFFRKTDSKWSAADNMEHLILSVKPLRFAFRLPKFCLLFFGKPNRPILAYEELVKKYLAKLDAGARATSPFVPKIKYLDKGRLLENFKATNTKFLKSLATWNEGDLDHYLLPHPLLGKLYAREMLYFTLYHTHHHMRAMEKRL